ncbi:T9SS type A sorting domain-containing protein [Balneolales bacterium ANBcel1]|nr:T9SS type A sorting domain-containing protein [Balneolales bacterium ANBcel1]
MMVFMGLFASVSAQFEGGNGEMEDPFQVATLEQLQEVAGHPDQHFIQIADIDASATAEWNDGAGFEPIGDDTIPFTGNYNGNGYEIDGLYINRPGEYYTGLFGYIKDASISNIGLIENAIVGQTGGADTVSVEGQYIGGLIGYNEGGTVTDSYATGNVSVEGQYVGGLVGYNYYGNVTGSHATGEVSGNWFTGGLIGENGGGTVIDSYATGDVNGSWFTAGLIGSIGSEFAPGGTVTDSYATGDVSGTGNTIGGLIGRNGGGVVTGSHAKGNVIGTGNNAGGLIGWNASGDVTGSHAEGNVIGTGDNVGGLIGWNAYGNVTESFGIGVVNGRNRIGGFIGDNLGGLIQDSYALGTVDGDEEVGGLVGANRNDGEITISFSAGTVSGNTDVGGFAGYNGGTIENCYWDTNSGEQEQGIGRGSSEGVIGLSTDQITGTSAHGNMEEFDFEEIWLLTEGYPALHWEDVESIKVFAEKHEYDQPEQFILHQNSPNPFNPSTRIRFAIPEQAHVKLSVYNLIGQQVATLVNGIRSAGWHDATFDASALSSGVFIYRIKAGEYVETRQMMFVK